MRELPDGWKAVFSEAHSREYFWHKESGATTWQPPGPPQGLAPESLPEAPPEEGGGAAAGQGPGVRLRARELPEGWCAVQSPEHQREYFWHRPSGRTSWEPPPLPVATVRAEAPQVGARAPEDAAGLLGRFGGRREVRRLRHAARELLHGRGLGEELAGEDFALVRGILEHHPDKVAKIGSGVRGIKVDESLHESGTRCFWVLRTDGSAEDFSIRRCLHSLESAALTSSTWKGLEG